MVKTKNNIKCLSKVLDQYVRLKQLHNALASFCWRKGTSFLQMIFHSFNKERSFGRIWTWFTEKEKLMYLALRLQWPILGEPNPTVIRFRTGMYILHHKIKVISQNNFVLICNDRSLWGKQWSQTASTNCLS